MLNPMMSRRTLVLDATALIGALAIWGAAQAQVPAPKTEVMWLGQAAFKITTPFDLAMARALQEAP